MACTPDHDGEPARGEPGQIEEPGKLLRIAAMSRAMLNEVRNAPLDDEGRSRFKNVYEATVQQLCDVLPGDLREELAAVFVPLGDGEPSEANIRIAQAQLIGWLEGLFNGIQAAVVTQQMAARQQLHQMRQSAGDGTPQPAEPGGLYL